jgi:hypothetical protein
MTGAVLNVLLDTLNKELDDDADARADAKLAPSSSSSTAAAVVGNSAATRAAGQSTKQKQRRVRPLFDIVLVCGDAATYSMAQVRKNNSPFKYFLSLS